MYISHKILSIFVPLDATNICWDKEEDEGKLNVGFSVVGDIGYGGLLWVIKDGGQHSQMHMVGLSLLLIMSCPSPKRLFYAFFETTVVSTLRRKAFIHTMWLLLSLFNYSLPPLINLSFRKRLFYIHTYSIRNNFMNNYHVPCSVYDMISSSIDFSF